MLGAFQNAEVSIFCAQCEMFGMFVCLALNRPAVPGFLCSLLLKF